MNSSRSEPRLEWLIAAGLIVLALIPSLAGAARLGELASGAVETAQNARFIRMPLPVIVHIVGALIYSLIGAFQFLPRFRRRHLAWHRFAGRYLLFPAGLAVAGTGLWMTAFYDVPPVDGLALQVSRYLVGALMLVFLILGIAAISRRDVASHRAWMIRAYALAMGAGTQVLTSAPFLLAFGAPDEFWRLVQMDAGWILNLIVAEAVIRRPALRRLAPRRRSAAVGG